VIDIKKEIASLIKQSLVGFTDEKINFLVENPENESFGDYSSNVALVAAKILKKSPLDLAIELVKKINISKLPEIEKVETAKPGFINFHLSQEYLLSQLGEISLRQGFAGKKIMVEFTDPNPFKEFHIGHLYSNTVGESVSRLLEAMGANLRRANYQGDVGMHVAKAIYGLQNFKIKIEDLEEKSLKEKIKTLGEAYALGAKAYEEDNTKKREIEELNKKIYAKDEAIMPFYEKGRQWSLEYFETVYKRLGTKFDFYYFESEVGINGLELVNEYLEKGVFEKSQGAVIFPGKKYNLHDRVFVNSLGLPTYEAKELGLAFKKYSDFEFDQSIVITGNEIIGYFKVLIAALGKINPDLASKIRHLPHGMVRLPTGKMSSRTGNIITGEWLLDEAKKLLKSKFSEMEEEVLEKVAVGSVKYALLKSSLGHDIEFDFEESINIQGNSGPYLQYTYVRTQSVLEKAKSDKRKETSEFDAPRPGLAKLEVEEMSLLRSLNKFSEVVGWAGEKFAPNILCNYLFDLAQKFNLFYQKHKIIGSDQEDFRLRLTQGVGQVVKTGLNLLGIQAPEKM
jgi:arginyl-tRNA synthetase